MKKVIKFTLNEKVFCELYLENGKYCVSAYFRYTKNTKSQEYKNYKDALFIYNFVTDSRYDE